MNHGGRCWSSQISEGQAPSLISSPVKLEELLASKRESECIPTALVPPVGAHGNYSTLLGLRMHHITKSGRPAVVRVLSSHRTCCSITMKLKVGAYLLHCKTW